MAAGAAAIFVTMLGAMYAAAADDRADVVSLRLVSVVSPEVPGQAALSADESVPAGRDVPDAIAAALDAERELVDPTTGVRLGPFTFGPAAEPASASSVRPARRPRARARPRRSVPRPAPVSPRLHANPGRHVIATARAMIARGEAINGSCYRYLSEVFSRAGHSGWRDRRVVYREGRTGPYADLGLVRTGDWLYIVNHPDRVPVGTHSVLFVSWEDRSRGIARVIEHPGWGAPTTGRERSYDVSRIYRVTRPIVR